MNIKRTLTWKTLCDIVWQQWITIMTLQEIFKSSVIFDRILRFYSVHVHCFAYCCKNYQISNVSKVEHKAIFNVLQNKWSLFIILHSQTQSLVWRILEILTFIPVDKRRHRHGTWDKSEAIKHLCLYLIHAGFLP